MCARARIAKCNHTTYLYIKTQIETRIETQIETRIETRIETQIETQRDTDRDTDTGHHTNQKHDEEKQHRVRDRRGRRLLSVMPVLRGRICRHGQATRNIAR